MSLSASQRARLGAFMIAGLVLIAIFIAVPVSRRMSNRQKTYHTYFTDESVSGLEEGADVKFRGVRVGKVSNTGYDPGDLSRVRIEFRVDHDFPMNSDMYLQTQMMGITMLKYLEISGGDDSTATAVEPGSFIPNKPSLGATITGKAEDIMLKVELLLNHLNTLTHPDSLAAVKEILDNVAAITDDAEEFFGGITPDVKAITGSARKTMDNVTQITTDIRGVTGHVNRTVDSEQLSGILVSIDSTAYAMKRLSETLELTLRQSREDFTVSMQNLREALENANEVTRMLAENPSLLLRSEQQKERRFR
jgi:phospholipid/cholesterol/gamma-HCH transport system substrate-binding protein